MRAQTFRFRAKVMGWPALVGLPRCCLIMLTVIAGLCSSAVSVAQEELIYVAVEPCRIVNTRKATDGAIKSGSVRKFKVWGTDRELAYQGGLVDCPNPRGEVMPSAVAAYVIAAPAASSSGDGVLTVFPSNLPTPAQGSGSTVNFAAGQVIGNTTIATICSEPSCQEDGELAILARNTDEDVIIDVQGFFYPQYPDKCFQSDFEGTWQTYVAESSQGGSSCTITIDAQGRVLNGNCLDTQLNRSNVTSGLLETTEECQVDGFIEADGIRNTINLGTLSKDRAFITGIASVNGVYTTVNATKY